MAEIGRLERETAKHDPRQVFSSPSELAVEVMLTRGEKLATLDRWRTMVLQELAAADEGMQTRGAGSRHARELDEIEKARADLMRGEGENE